MKKVIGIYCGYLGGYNWDESYILDNGGGGSETWAVEMSREFQKRGFHVIVFGEPKSWCFAPSGVEYVPWIYFEHRCEYQHFDYFISSRQINEIGDFIKCPNIYIMAHDICLHYADKYGDLKLDRVKKIGYLSDWHKWALTDWYENKIQDNQFFKTINGIDSSLYIKSDVNKKENSMVWSSRQERGLNYFIDWVFPLIKEQVPDFKLYVCLYLNDFNRTDLSEGIEFIGKVGKNDLSELQKKSKIWIYPNLGFLDTNGFLFQETFCISAVENGCAKNAIICGNNGGLKTTLKGYSGLIGDEFINDGLIQGGENMKKYAQQIAEESIKILKNDDYRIQLANEAYDICSQYTWENAVDTWLDEWKIKY